MISARASRDMSVPGARRVARLPGTAHVPFTVTGAETAYFVRRHLALSGVMLAGQAPVGGRIDAGLPRSHQRR
jgi:hypothetical protein